MEYELIPNKGLADEAKLFKDLKQDEQTRVLIERAKKYS